MFQKNLSELDKELDELNSEISHSETEIAKRNLLIGRKQGAINLYNKKLEMMISQLGVCSIFFLGLLRAIYMACSHIFYTHSIELKNSTSP